ncbi:MAG: hypothetical protein SGPRY_002528, partial [Prymnesium sp.]
MVRSWVELRALTKQADLIAVRFTHLLSTRTEGREGLYRDEITGEVEGQLAVYQGRWEDEEGMIGWLASRRLPLLAEVGPSNYMQYEALGVPLFFLFLNGSCCEELNGRVRGAVREEAAGRRGAAAFVWVDGEAHGHYAPSASRAAGLLPALAADYNGQHYVYTGSMINSRQMGQWVEGVILSKFPPTLRSAPAPLESWGPVTVVVASTMEELVLDAGVDVLLLITAAWCEECEVVGAEVEKVLASAWEGDDRVRVASLDVGANDVPRTLRSYSLPGLAFFAAN